MDDWSSGAAARANAVAGAAAAEPTLGPVTPVPEFDRYARLVQILTGAPTAVVGFIIGDVEEFSGAIGLPPELREARAIPIEHSLCLAVQQRDAPLVLADIASDPAFRHHFAVQHFGVMAYLGFPVRNSRGEMIATLCAVDYAPREWDERSIAVMTDLADACGSEVQLREQREQAVAAREVAERIGALTSELLEQRATVAHTLQAAMLTDLPRPEGLALDAVYAPASATEDVGGDWYDAMVLADGGVAIAVGDITGHDIAAATVMGQMRSMLRALWWEHDKPPSNILSLLDEASIGTGLCATGTALLARFEPGLRGSSRRVIWSSAGHPLPVIARADGSVEVPGARPDPLLGFQPGCVRTDRVVDLDPGDTMVLFTDGLVERRGETLGDGIARLIEAVRSGLRAPWELLDDVSPAHLRNDDVVVLTVSLAQN